MQLNNYNTKRQLPTKSNNFTDTKINKERPLIVSIYQQQINTNTHMQ